MSAKTQRMVNALIDGELGLASELLAQGCDLSWTAAGTRFTALHWAVERGLADFAGELVAAGADPNARDAEGLTPLMMAMGKNELPCVRLLLPLADWELRDMRGQSVMDKAETMMGLTRGPAFGALHEKAVAIFELVSSESDRRFALAEALALREAIRKPEGAGESARDAHPAQAGRPASKMRV